MSDTTHSTFLALVIAAVIAAFVLGPDGYGGASYEDAISASDRIDRGLVAQPPRQADVPRFRRKAFEKDGYRITPVASFDVSALVLGAKTYRFDRGADLSPVDLALGWGRMTDPDLLARLKITQSGRFYRWRYKDSNGRNAVVIPNSSNMHMIPATDEIEDSLRSVRAGDIVRISGLLVNASHPDGWRWKTSTRRTDTGSGACEIVLVERIEIVAQDAEA